MSMGPMKYALSLQMGTRQFYQRPPNSDVTEAQKGKIKEALDEIRRWVMVGAERCQIGQCHAEERGQT